MKKIKNIMKNRAFLALLVLICTVLTEIFIFNFTSFKLGKDYKESTLDITSATLQGFEYKDGVYVSNSKSPYIEFKGINEKIGTLYIDVTLEKNSSAVYNVDFTDETNSSYSIRTNLVNGSITQGAERTKYVNCQFSGNAGDIKIKFSNFKGTVQLNSVQINRDIPISFSPIRVFVTLLVIYLGYFLLKSRVCSQKLSDSRAVVKTITAVVCMICVVSALLLTSNIFETSLFQTGGDQITKELVDAFEKGNITLDREVEDELLALKNPYDWAERNSSGVKHAWDHVMYEGKYYSYYGIAPVVLLFLPFHIITGYYFSTVWAVFLFGAAGLVFLALFFKKLCERFFSNISVGLYISSLLTVLLGSGIWFCFVTPNFYEIAQNSGFMFVCMGAYFLISSGILSDNVSKVKLCLSSVFFSLAVLSRPTTAVWCIAAVAFIVLHLISLIKEKKSFIPTALYAFIPFAVIGGVQMIYNYARFDSFVDFGIQYSLTINDFTRSEFSPQMALIGFYNFLFAFPSVKPDFPFISSNFSDLGVNGFYYIANRISTGIFFRIPAVFSVLLLPRGVKTLEKKKRLPFVLLWLLCFAVLPFAVIYSIWESGYGVRYCVDFTWQMTVCAFILLFMMYQKYSENKTVQRICEYACAISLFITFIINVALIWEYSCSIYGNTVISATLKDTFEFWK